MYEKRPRGWLAKFATAFHGQWQAAKGQSSFHVHGLFAVAVVAAALFLRVDRLEWCLLVLCITLVLTAETFNSALETLARVVDREYNRELGAALDMASGAVLHAAVGSAIVGFLILGYHAAVWCGWWG